MRPARAPDKLSLVLADDPELARQVIYHLRRNALEHHPSGWLGRTVLDPARSSVECAPSAAAMACELQQGVLNDYLAAVGTGRPIGYVNWPLLFLAH